MRKYKPKGFWDDYNNCYTEAKKYSNRSEFALRNNRAYVVAKTKGWLNDYTWFVNRATLLAQTLTKWSYDACYAEAKKYVTRGGFQKGNNVAYQKARKEGWLKDYNWFVSGRKILAQKRTKWTYDSCYNEARKYTIASKFQHGSSGAYNVARENGWLKDYLWFKVKQHNLTYEYCRDCALQCKTRTEFSNAFGSAYNKSREKGWMDNFDWLERRLNPYSDNIDNVYGYFWESVRCCYIGRSIDVERRDWQHRTSEKSTPYRMAQEMGLPIPPMKILERGLSLSEGLKREAEYCKKFEGEGWSVGNIAPVGEGSGSIGRIGAGKWNKNSCLKEALKYKTYKQFREMSPTAYVTAKRKGWLHTYEFLSMSRHKSGFWNYETCYNEARQYTTASSFERGNGSAYNVAREKGWIKDYDWFVSGRKEAAIKRRLWDKSACYNEARKYKTLRRFRHDSSGAYKTACRNGWIKDYEWLTRKCPSKGFYSYERVAAESKKYSTFGQFRKGSPKYYDKAAKMGWLKDFVWLKRLLHAPWTYAECLREAKKFITLADFRKNSASAYVRAVKEGWIKKFGFLRRGENKPKLVKQYSLDGRVIAIYKCADDAVRRIGLQTNSKGIRDCCNRRQKTCGGFIWRYIDDVEELVCSYNVKKKIMQKQ